MASNKPLVTILLSVFNGMPYLKECVQSLRNQDYPLLEILIFDDGSTDGSGEWLEKQASEDARISLIRQSNQGLTPTLNRGVRLAQGKYIARIDSDDIAFRERISRQVDFLENPINEEVVVVGTCAEIIDEDGEIVWTFRLPQDHFTLTAKLKAGVGGVILHPSVMMRTDALVKVGGYREKFRRGQDFDLWIRLSEVGKLANIDEPLIYWRHHDSSIGYTASEEQWQSIVDSLKDAAKRQGLSIADLPDPPRNFVRSKPTDRHLSLARHAYQSNHRSVSRKHARYVMKEVSIGSRVYWECLSFFLKPRIRGLLVKSPFSILK